MRSEIERVITGIREGYGDALTLADLSEVARLSPYHMARIFRQETGLPPATFLAAVRMEAARRILLETEDSVADISVRVGYTSVGTFTTRFTKTVGMSPGRYRRLALLGAGAVGLLSGEDDEASAYGSVAGRIRRSDGPSDAEVFVAVFPPDVAQGAAGKRRCAARCGRVSCADDPYNIAFVPEGLWVVQAVSRGDGPGREATLVGTAGPFRVSPGVAVRADVTLGPAARAKFVDENRFKLGTALPRLFDTPRRPTAQEALPAS